MYNQPSWKIGHSSNRGYYIYNESSEEPMYLHSTGAVRTIIRESGWFQTLKKAQKVVDTFTIPKIAPEEPVDPNNLWFTFEIFPQNVNDLD